MLDLKQALLYLLLITGHTVHIGNKTKKSKVAKIPAHFPIFLRPFF